MRSTLKTPHSNFVRQTYLANLEAKLTIEARRIGDVVAPTLQSGASDLDAAARHWADLLDARVTIVVTTGVVLGESSEDRAQTDNHASRPEIAAALIAGQGQQLPL